jgi:hypothetical protein
VVSRHEFLAELHKIVRPRVYLEVGVQHGTSLDLAFAADAAIGIDPKPLTHPKDNQIIIQSTADAYFAKHTPMIYMAFVDGSHLAEDALRDVFNIGINSVQKTVVVMDDVLPRNEAEASRTQCPGDWTGDVWRVPPVLDAAGLNVFLVDTWPTGTAVLLDLKSVTWDEECREFMESSLRTMHPQYSPVPDEILTRQYAISPESALGIVQEFMNGQ